MFEINTDVIRKESNVFSSGAEDIALWKSEVLEAESEISSFTGMEDIAALLEDTASAMAIESDHLYSIGEALRMITDRYDDTEEEITDEIESFKYINFENKVVMGNFDTEIRNDFTVNADKAVMEELIKLIS